MMAWFYRGSRHPVAHWFDPAAEVSLCGRIRPDPVRGVAWRHPTHDQHIPFCKHCQEKLAMRRRTTADRPTDPAPPEPEPDAGVKGNGGGVSS